MLWDEKEVLIHHTYPSWVMANGNIEEKTNKWVSIWKALPECCGQRGRQCRVFGETLQAGKGGSFSKMGGGLQDRGFHSSELWRTWLQPIKSEGERQWLKVDLYFPWNVESGIPLEGGQRIYFTTESRSKVSDESRAWASPVQPEERRATAEQ